VGVGGRWLSMGSPPSVSDAAAAAPLYPGQTAFQGLDLAHRLLAEYFPIPSKDQAAGVIPAILQLPESLQQDRERLALAEITENSTHRPKALA